MSELGSHSAKSLLFDAFSNFSYSVLYRTDATFLSFTEKFQSAEFRRSNFTSSSPSEKTFGREIASLYGKGSSGIPQIQSPYALSDSDHFDVFQNYVLRAEKRDGLFSFLKGKGVETLIKDPIPCHKHPNLNLSNFSLPFSEQLAKEVISLPMYPELTQKQIDYVINCVREFYSK